MTLPGASLPQFLTPGSHLFLGDRTVLSLGHGDQLILLGLAVWLARKLIPRFGMVGAVVLAAVAFLVVYGVLTGMLPSLGHLAANVAHTDQFGYARAATETPQPITNILARSLVIGGKTIAPGQIVYPGFDPDVLWRFRLYSMINQLLIWTVIGLTFGALLDRYLRPPAPQAKTEPTEREPAGAAS